MDTDAAPGTPRPSAPSFDSSALAEDLARLLQSPLPPAEFYGEFLKRVCGTLGATAGAVWAVTTAGAFTLENRVNAPAVGLDRFPDMAAFLSESLRKAAEAGRPVWVPPDGGAAEVRNPTNHGLLLVPVLVDGQSAGVIEVWLEPERAPEVRRSGARLLAELAGFAAAFLHREQWRQLKEQQRAWDRCEAFARRVHASLDARQVALLIATEGRSLADCDQVAVAVCRGRGVAVEAVSGAATVEPRSPLIRAMRQLCAAVLAWGEVLVYAGARAETLPPTVAHSLDAYLKESNGRTLVVLPVRDESREGEPRCAAVLGECFGAALPAEQLRTRLDVVARYAGPALCNALEYGRVAAGPAARLWGRLRDWTGGRRRRKALVAAAVLLTVTGALTLVPASLRIEARGHLLPKERRTVYADLAGKVVELKAQHGEQVQKGQELLFVQDLETQLKVDQLAIRAAFAEQRVAVLNEQLARAAGEERTALVRERVAQEYELRKAAAERDILLQHGPPRKAPVTAPLAGKVVTFDAREQLTGKAVRPGDPLLRVARVHGPWEVEVLIPEGRLAAIREGLQRSRAGLEVELRLSSQPLRIYRGTLRRDGLGGEATVKDGAAVLPARVEIADEELAAQLAGLPVGLEVRVRIDCGPRPVGHVWFGDLVEFFCEHVLF